MHCHTRQHSEYYNGFRKIKRVEELQTQKANAENSCGKTQHLHLHRSVQTASHWTNDSAQSTTPILISQTIVWEMQTLPWDDGSHQRASVEISSLPSKRNSTCVCHTLVADWLRVGETSKLSAWLLLNIHYFPSEKWSGWNRTNRTGGYGHVCVAYMKKFCVAKHTNVRNC